MISATGAHRRDRDVARREIEERAFAGVEELRKNLLKDRPASELAEAIRRVHTGLRAVDPALAAEAWSADEDPLSDRERQILQRAGDGRSSSEIASELRLSEGTVRTYLSEAIAKLGASNRVDAARIARTKGWL